MPYGARLNLTAQEIDLIINELDFIGSGGYSDQPGPKDVKALANRLKEHRAKWPDGEGSITMFARAK